MQVVLEMKLIERPLVNNLTGGRSLYWSDLFAGQLPRAASHRRRDGS